MKIVADFSQTGCFVIRVAAPRLVVREMLNCAIARAVIYLIALYRSGLGAA